MLLIEKNEDENVKLYNFVNYTDIVKTLINCEADENKKYKEDESTQIFLVSINRFFGYFQFV